MEKTKESLVEICDLAVTYSSEKGPPIRALDGVDLKIRTGEVVGILGESGCGKSTLACALLQTLPPHAEYSAKSILLRGRNLLNCSENEWRTIRGREVSLIAQDPALALNPVITSGDQIDEVLRAHHSWLKQQRRDRIFELLEEVGFDHPAEICSAYPHQLSGGQRQRIVIAQAVACRPSLVIADEPTTKLDATLQAEILALLRRIQLQHGTSILLISHDPAVLAGFADRIAVMYAGRIVEVGSSSEILGRPLHPYTQALVRIAASSAFVGTGKKVRLPAIDGDPPDPTCLSAGCRFEPRCSERMDKCALRYPSEFLPEPARPVNCFKYGE